MPKTVWKFGKVWVGKKPGGKQKIFKTQALAKKFVGKAKKRKSNPKKSKRSRAKGAIKRATRRRSNPNRGGSMGKRKAISINVMKTVAIAAAAGALAVPVWNQIKFGKPQDIPLAIKNALKKDWKLIVGLPLAAALLSRALGRFSPRAGIPGAVSIKAF